MTAARTGQPSSVLHGSSVLLHEKVDCNRMLSLPACPDLFFFFRCTGGTLRLAGIHL